MGVKKRNREISKLKGENQRLALLHIDSEKECYATARENAQLRKDNDLMAEYCAMQEAWHSRENLRAYNLRERLRHERKETAKWRRTALAGVAIMMGAVMIMAVASYASAADSTAEAEPVAVCEAIPTGEDLDDAPETEENALIEAALFESGYFRADIPLDGDTQAELRAACEEFGVQYELALAVIHQETNFRNVTGDGGKSIGYMQLQPRWNRARMSELGIRDLSIPYDNFRVGCSLLSELISRYGLVGGLTAYNTGAPGTSAYASEVIAYMAKLEG